MAGDVAGYATVAEIQALSGLDVEKELQLGLRSISRTGLP
jgi:hypothetical protein